MANDVETKSGSAAAAVEQPRAGAAKIVTLKIDGREVAAPAGTMVIKVAHDNGIHVPYFCYHPGLTPEGNCRMCLVEVSGARKPVPACMTPVAQGMEVLTTSEPARTAQADVLEFMLLNHPLDCPICDKSGECQLQDNSFDHGKDHSRMVEPKELKPTKDLGADIAIWGNRCIVCTRCVRFCQDVVGSGELTVVNRGDHSVIDVFPDTPLSNPLAGNVVDICPVGALISKRFLYQARVWLENKTDTVCTTCARGCNVRVETLGNQIKRIVPRHNPEVNGYWMCDYGRWDFDYVLGPRRVLSYRLGSSSPGPSSRPADAARFLAEGLLGVVARHGPKAIAAIGSAFLTLENAYILRRLFEILGVPIENLAARARPDGPAQTFKGGFRISADANPNRAGVRAVLGDDVFGPRLEALCRRLRAGEMKALLVFHDIPHLALGAGDDGAAITSALPKLELAAAFLLEAQAGLPANTAVLPATAFSERNGSVINDDGRIQLLRRATELPRGIKDEHEILEDVLVRCGGGENRTSPEGVLRQAAQVVPGLAGLDYKSIGARGVLLRRADVQ